MLQLYTWYSSCADGLESEKHTQISCHFAFREKDILRHHNSRRRNINNMCRACAQQGCKLTCLSISYAFGGSSLVHEWKPWWQKTTLLTDIAHHKMKSKTLMKINAESILHKNVERFRSDRERKYEESINKISNFVSHIWGLLVQHIEIEKEKKKSKRNLMFFFWSEEKLRDFRCWISPINWIWNLIYFSFERFRVW